MRRSTAIVCALVGAFLFSGMASETAQSANPCAQMKKEIAKLRRKADRKREKWTELATYGHVGGSGVSNAIDSVRIGSDLLKGTNKGTIRQLMQESAHHQAEADALEAQMRNSANCGEGRPVANHNKRRSATASGGFDGPDIVVGMGPGNGHKGKGKGKNKNNNNQQAKKNKKKKKKGGGGGMDSGGGCAC